MWTRQLTVAVGSVLIVLIMNGFLLAHYTFQQRVLPSVIQIT